MKKNKTLTETISDFSLANTAREFLVTINNIFCESHLSVGAHNARNVGWDILKQVVGGGDICCFVAHFLWPDLALEGLPTLLSTMCFTYADLCVGSGGESQESGPSYLGEVLLFGDSG